MLLRRSVLSIVNYTNLRRSISLNHAVRARQIVRPTAPKNESQIDRFAAPSSEPLDRRPMLELIKSSSEPIEMLRFFKNVDKNDIQPQVLSSAMDQLLALQRNNRTETAIFLRHEGFIKMCNLLKFKAPRMEANELLICLKALVYFGVTTDTVAVHRLLNVIKDRINDFSPVNLLFLNFILSKAKQTPLSQAICAAIPSVLDLNIDLKLDRENPNEVAEMIRYMAAPSLGISLSSKLKILKAAASLGHTFTAQQAKNILSSLSVVQDFVPAFNEIILNCYSIMSKNMQQLTYHDVETTIDYMLDAHLRGFDIFYNETFFNDCVKFLVQQDLGYLNKSYILRKFNKICFVNLQLLEYLDGKLTEGDPKIYNGKIAGPITLATAFSNANFKSKHQDTLKTLMNENLKLHMQRLEVPWLKLAQDLMSLGFHSQVLLERVFSTEYLEKTLKRKQKYNDHMHLLLLWQSVNLLIPGYKGPLPNQKFIEDALLLNKPMVNQSLEKILKQSFGQVQNNVLTKYGHLLDYVVAFNATEAPVEVNVKTFQEISEDMRVVAVFLHGPSDCPINLPRRLRGAVELKLKTVRALGIRTVSVFSHAIEALPECEREAYINREVRYALT